MIKTYLQNYKGISIEKKFISNLCFKWIPQFFCNCFFFLFDHLVFLPVLCINIVMHVHIASSDRILDNFIVDKTPILAQRPEG